MSAYDPVTIDDGQPATQAAVGPTIGGADVEVAIRSTLQTWLPSYLAEYERQHELVAGSTPAPRGWVRTGRDLAKFGADQLPCVLILSAGIIEPPYQESADGCLTGIFGVEVGVMFAAAWGGASRGHAQAYAVAISLVMTQRPLEDLEATVDYRGESYDELDFDVSRTYSASICRFNVTVRGIRWTRGGPPPYAGPPTDPTAPLEPWTTVVDTDVTVETQPPD